MRTKLLRHMLAVSALLGVCAPAHAQSMMGQEAPEFQPSPKTSTNHPEISPTVLDEILQTQAAMPGGGTVPFTEFDQGVEVAPIDVPMVNSANSFNYSVGSPAPVFDSPAFTEVQAGATGEDRPE